ncbi:MAG: FAD-binding oxidoreductase [Saprospiraceae bacterium]|nr:FAD-binding oxidoreductase [Saprospiraceae bacterium]
MKANLSWWEFDHYLSKVDYTIVGGGIVGLSTAIELKEMFPDTKILIVDKKTLPIGASTKNAGFACFGSISEIVDDLDKYGEEVCRKLIKLRWEGLSILKSRIPHVKMRYRDQPGAEVFISKGEAEAFVEKIGVVNDLVADIVHADQCFNVENGKFGVQINNSLEGSLNPQMMMKELELIARNAGVLFLNGVDVFKIDRVNKTLETNLGKMCFQNLIVCTNGFSRKLLPHIDIHPARNQVFITNRVENFNLEHCYHMNKGFVYFREYNGRLLIGGGRDLDLVGETTSMFGTTERIINYLKDIVSNHILQGVDYEITQQWSGILGVGKSKMPVVKKIEDDIVVAIRMGGMGVAVGSIIGKITAAEISSSDNSAHQLYVS